MNRKQLNGKKIKLSRFFHAITGWIETKNQDISKGTFLSETKQLCIYSLTIPETDISVSLSYIISIHSVIFVAMNF